jgi:hypothetical protein
MKSGEGVQSVFGAHIGELELVEDIHVHRIASHRTVVSVLVGIKIHASSSIMTEKYNILKWNMHSNVNNFPPRRPILSWQLS